MIVYSFLHINTIKQELQKLNAKVLAVFAVFILFGIIASQLIFYKLAHAYDIHKVTALTFVSPVFTVILAAVLLGENPTMSHIIGIILVVIGVMLVGGTK